MTKFDLEKFKNDLSRLHENVALLKEDISECKTNMTLPIIDQYKNWTVVDYVWVAHELLGPLIVSINDLENKLKEMVGDFQALRLLLMTELSNLPKDDKIPPTYDDDVPF